MGAVTFKISPNFEAPADAGANNIYDVVVNVSDGSSTTQQAVTITVSDVAEGLAPVLDLNGPGTGSDATATYARNVTTPQLITAAATITDADSATLTALTATLTGQQDTSGGNVEALSLSSAALSAATSAGLTVTWTLNASGGVLSVTGTASKATYQTVLQGLRYVNDKPGAHTEGVRTITVTASDGANTSVAHTVSIAVAKPAGVAGEPINLALDAPEGAIVTVHVSSLPTNWTINGAVQKGDGSWVIETADASSLTVTTPATYAGAVVLDITMSWTNADGSTSTVYVSDNVEAFAPGNPIFAWSGDDTLTGSAEPTCSSSRSRSATTWCTALTPPPTRST